MTAYFAYASNLWRAQMAFRCPGSRLIGRARLRGYRWIIHERGYASVVASANDLVEGSLYTLTPANQAALDRFEHVAEGWYHPAQVLIETAKETCEARVYLGDSEAEGLPKAEYILRIN